MDGVPLTGPGRAPFSVSAAGVLAYWSYSVGTPAVLQWFDRTGRATPAVGAPAQYLGFDLAQNGQLVYSRAAANGTTDVWRSDIVGGTEHQVTFDGASYTPQWSPDGTVIVFSSPNDRLPPNMFAKRLSDSQSGVPSQPLHDARLSVQLEPRRPLDCQRPNRFLERQRSVAAPAAAA